MYSYDYTHDPIVAGLVLEVLLLDVPLTTLNY
jgi:hypothetical protein